MRVVFALLAILALFVLMVSTSWPQVSGQQTHAAFVARDVPQSTSPVPRNQESPPPQEVKGTVDANQSVVSSNASQSTSQASRDQKPTIQRKPKVTLDANQSMLSITGPQSVSQGSQ